MAEIVARFADGRLLVREEGLVSEEYTSGTGTLFRIGYVRTVEKIISLDAYVSGYFKARVAAPIAEAKVSGDAILVILRRADMVLSGEALCEQESFGELANITSGLEWGSELGASGSVASSLIVGKLAIVANVIGY